MPIQAKILSTDIQAKYSRMVSKLITLLQQNVVQLMSLNMSHFDNSLQKSQNKLQKYKFLLGKMKLYQQQKSLQLKYSHLCQPLLNRINFLDDQKLYQSVNLSEKSRSFSSKSSNFTTLNRSFYQQKTPKMKHSLDLKKSNKIKTKNMSISQHIQALKDFQRYKRANETPVLQKSSEPSCQKMDEPCPGKSSSPIINVNQNRSAKFNQFPAQQQSEPTLPQLKQEIIISRTTIKNQISNRTMTEFSRAKQLEQIDEEKYLLDEIDADKNSDEQEIYSFQMVETPHGTVYGKQQEVKVRAPTKFRHNIYKKFIDRTHLKRSSTQSS